MSKSFSMISLVIFDFWKTLAYRDVQESSTKQMLRLTNSSIPHKEFVKIFESALQTKKWDSKFEAYAHLCEKMDLPVTPENVNLLISIRDTAEECVKPFNHTLSMLQQLKEAGYKIGIISNSSIFAYEKIKEKTTISYFWISSSWAERNILRSFVLFNDKKEGTCPFVSFFDIVMGKDRKNTVPTEYLLRYHWHVLLKVIEFPILTCHKEEIDIFGTLDWNYTN